MEYKDKYTISRDTFSVTVMCFFDDFIHSVLEMLTLNCLHSLYMLHGVNSLLSD
jgi:hypothetical protein